MRAKAAELETYVQNDYSSGLNQHRAIDRVQQLTADVALLFSLLADIVDREVEREGPWVPAGDPLFAEDGTPWTESALRPGERGR